MASLVQDTRGKPANLNISCWPVGEGALPMRVLVVDRDTDVLASTVRSLEAKEGWKVEGTASFVDARRLLGLKPDVVVADVRLGEYNGLHLAMLARRADPNVHVIVTGGPEDASLRGDVEALDAEFVAKPYTGRELAAHIMGQQAPDPMVCRVSAR